MQEWLQEWLQEWVRKAHSSISAENELKRSRDCQGFQNPQVKN